MDQVHIVMSRVPNKGDYPLMVYATYEGAVKELEWWEKEYGGDITYYIMTKPLYFGN